MFIDIVAGLGVAGDAHSGKTVKHRSRVAADPTQPNLRQVHLIASELLDEVNGQGFDVSPGALGENITTRGIDLIGLPRGTLDYGGSERIIDHTAVRPGDSFSVAVDGGRAKTITIEARDTYLTLTFKINAALVLDGKASVARSSEGNRLRIEPREGVKIQIGAGPEGKDALKAMGLSAGVVYEAPEVDEDDKASAAPPLYGLDIDFASALKEKDSAKAAAAMLGDAMKTWWCQPRLRW